MSFLFLLSSFLTLTFSDNPKQYLSIYISNGGYNIVNELKTDADVNAMYQISTSTTGWDTLEIKTNVKPTATDLQRGFAAGIAEGYLTSYQISLTYNNTINSSMVGLWDYTNGPSTNLQQFINEQNTYMNEQISKNKNDPFWIYVNILNNQLYGLQYGYNLTAIKNNVPQYNNIWPFLFLNLVGDILDLENALNPETRIDYRKYSAREYLNLMLKRGRCSALVKITPEIDNLFIGHSSWFIYQNMYRIFKHYIFDFELKTATRHMMFSSYPGYLESLDDFYMMDSGLAMLQTTNGIPNTTVYDLVTPNSLYAFQRVRIANALAYTGEEWYNYLANQNSGTYNNQYMIINYKLFEKNKPLKDNTLWVVEQMPGMVAGMDMTDILERGYWASYNVPAIESIYNASGYPDLVATHGVENSYDLAPRARIFRRDANNVYNLDTYKKILRYNNYKNDSIENNDPMWAICSRGDLESQDIDPQPFGCYDTKVANLSMILNMQASIINGPTYDNLPPFNWEDWPQYNGYHNGIPNLMRFDWQWQQSELA